MNKKCNVNWAAVDDLLTAKPSLLAARLGCTPYQVCQAKMRAKKRLGLPTRKYNRKNCSRARGQCSHPGCERRAVEKHRSVPLCREHYVGEDLLSPPLMAQAAQHVFRWDSAWW